MLTVPDIAAFANAAEPLDPAGFGSHLLAEQAIDGAALERAQRAAASTGEPLESVLTKLGLMSEEEVAQRQSAFWKMPRLTLEDLPAEPLTIDGLELSFLRDNRLIPLSAGPGVVQFVTDQPFRTEAVRTIAYMTECRIRTLICTPSQWERSLLQIYGSALEMSDADLAGGGGETDEIDVHRLRDIASEAPIIRMVSQIIASAVEARASDIHIEPSQNDVEVRYRVDGVLRLARTVPQQFKAAVTSRIKIMARLDIAERRLPQDGRIRTAVQGIDIDLRVSTLPTALGESIVLRILDRSRVALEFAGLGFNPAAVAAIRKLVNRPNGIFLVTGPTGSGKTTTLYTAIKELDSTSLKIVTVEDPVEYQLPAINQVQVQPQIGLDFPAALRSILRQDPDVIMIGEIRDLETARIAIQASLTGHLVLSTVHTNSAAATVMRLIDMGVEDYLLASTLQGILAQRLVRRLCVSCTEPHPDIKIWEKRLNPPKGARLLSPRGCAHCNGTGYRGRRTISELLTLNPDIRRAVTGATSEQALFECARASGFQTMYEDGLAAVFAGETSIEEVLGVVQDE
jgi:general secretion pathway protein E